MRVKITGTGMYVPPRVETAADIAPRIGRTEEWIIERTGVARRHVAEEPVEEMAARAGRQALGDGPPPDLILNASTTPRQAIPDNATFIQQALGFSGLPAFSVHATCLSFLVALRTAGCFVATGTYRRVLVVSSEHATFSRNFDEPESAPLFGDGAAAAVVEPTPDGEDSAILSWRMGTWPEGADLTEIRGGGMRRHPLAPGWTREDYLFHMDGTGVYKKARRRFLLVTPPAVRDAGLTVDDIDVVVPHQASGSVLQHADAFGVPPEKVVNIIGEYGNCVAASIPMALHVAIQDGRIRRGSRLLLVGTGAGLSIAAAVLRY